MLTISYSRIEIEIREFKYQVLYLSVFIYIYLSLLYPGVYMSLCDRN